MRTIKVYSRNQFVALDWRRPDEPQAVEGYGWPRAGWTGTFADALRQAPAMSVQSPTSWLVALTRNNWLSDDEYFTLARLLAFSVIDGWREDTRMPDAIKLWLATGDDNVVCSARDRLRQIVIWGGKDSLMTHAERAICRVVFNRWEWIMRLKAGCAFWYPGDTLRQVVMIVKDYWVEYPPAPAMWTIQEPGYAECQRRLLAAIDSGLVV